MIPTCSSKVPWVLLISGVSQLTPPIPRTCPCHPIPMQPLFLGTSSWISPLPSWEGTLAATITSATTTVREALSSCQPWPGATQSLARGLSGPPSILSATCIPPHTGLKHNPPPCDQLNALRAVPCPLSLCPHLPCSPVTPSRDSAVWNLSCILLMGVHET